MTIFKSNETVHLIMLCNSGEDVGCAVLADLKMVARNLPLIGIHYLVNICITITPPKSITLPNIPKCMEFFSSRFIQ